MTLLARVALLPPEPDAWNEFVDRYGPRIVKWSRAWGLQAADIDDVTQSVLATLLVRLRQFVYDPSRSFRAFLRKVTNDTVCDVISASRPAGWCECDATSACRSRGPGRSGPRNRGRV